MSDTTTPAPTGLDEAISDHVAKLLAFQQLHIELRAQATTEGTPNEVIAELNNQVLDAWDQVIVGFMLLNGFFDFVLEQHGLAGSGIVNLHQLMSMAEAGAIDTTEFTPEGATENG